MKQVSSAQVEIQNPFGGRNRGDGQGRPENRERDDDGSQGNRGRDNNRQDDRRDNHRRWNFVLQQLFPQNRLPFPQSEIQFIQNGVIQRISGDRKNGYVTVANRGGNIFFSNQNQVVTLIITPDTMLRDQNLQQINLNDLRVGMTVFAAYSTRMSRSIPPQAVALSMIAIVEEPFIVSRGIVTFVNPRAGTLTTGSWNDINRQMIYNVSANTEIYNRRGQRISLNQINPGDRVRIEHATFQTASIPPQTTAYKINIIR